LPGLFREERTMARSTDRTKVKTTGSSSLALRRGRRLGKYRLAKYLGEGGSCEVWKARDSIEGIWVALKIPLADTHGKRDNQALVRTRSCLKNCKTKVKF